MRALFAIAVEIAGRQHGRVTRRQLLAAGIDAERIRRWLADGRLRNVHHGVYAVGHVAPSMHGDYSGGGARGRRRERSSPTRRARTCSS